MNRSINEDTPLTGECFCGDIKYTISAPLKDARSCHCSRCRKINSGAASAYAEVETGSFTWISGEEKLTIYGKSWQLAFCSQCGTTLCGLYGGEIHGVMLGPLNDDPGIVIEKHIFTGSKASWDEIGGDAPQFEEFPPQ